MRRDGRADLPNNGGLADGKSCFRATTGAIVAVSAMVGALGLSRVMTDPKRSDAILLAARDYVTAMAAPEGAAPASTGR